jgi:hypothetical protein
MRERVLKYMQDFNSITTYNAFIDLGCTRLSEYIRQLRMEYKIADEWISTVNRYGEKVKYKRYWLEEEKCKVI